MHNLICSYLNSRFLPPQPPFSQTPISLHTYVYTLQSICCPHHSPTQRLYQQCPDHSLSCWLTSTCSDHSPSQLLDQRSCIYIDKWVNAYCTHVHFTVYRWLSGMTVHIHVTIATYILYRLQYIYSAIIIISTVQILCIYKSSVCIIIICTCTY